MAVSTSHHCAVHNEWMAASIPSTHYVPAVTWIDKTGEHVA